MLLSLLAGQSAHAEWQFTDVSQASGAAHDHGYMTPQDEGFSIMAGGVAAGDYDNDGDVDLYLNTGDISPNALLQNNGDGSFSHVSTAAGVGLDGIITAGPAFADINGDGWLDLVVGGVAGSGYRVFANQGDGSFTDVTVQSGIFAQTAEQNDYSSAFGDPDRDGDLDIFISHWGADEPVNHLWLNDGNGVFQAADMTAGIDVFNIEDWSFSPVFTDINRDGFQDLLVAADFGTSKVLINNGEGGFYNATSFIIDDENGMGTTAADFDNDGDIDWFVSSIYDEDDAIKAWGGSGNRLYQNQGNGEFANITAQAGVGQGHWGWGSCAADFNNDGWLDIFHVNGMPAASDYSDYNVDPSRMFINHKDGSFYEYSSDVGILDQGQGRGLVCFDYDLDGDLDLFISNYLGQSRLLRNDLNENPGFLQIKLGGEGRNTHAVGARIEVLAGGITQTREVTVGSNFESQNPLTQHFGLDGAGVIDQVRVWWPQGNKTLLRGLAPNQSLYLSPGRTCLQAADRQSCRRQPDLTGLDTGQSTQGRQLIDHNRRTGTLPPSGKRR